MPLPSHRARPTRRSVLAAMATALALRAPRAAWPETQHLDIPVPAGTMPCILHLPDGRGRHPAVVMLPDIYGPDSRAIFHIERLLSDGIAVAVTHPWTPRGIVPEDAPATEDDPAALLPDLAATISALARHDAIDPGRIGGWGWGLGGATVLHAWALGPPFLAAAVALYPETRRLGRGIARVAATPPMTPAMVLSADGIPDGDGAACLAALHRLAPGAGADVFEYPDASYGFDLLDAGPPPVMRLWPDATGAVRRVRGDVLAAEDARTRAGWFLATALDAPSARR